MAAPSHQPQPAPLSGPLGEEGGSCGGFRACQRYQGDYREPLSPLDEEAACPLSPPCRIQRALERGGAARFVEGSVLHLCKRECEHTCACVRGNFWGSILRNCACKHSRRKKYSLKRRKRLCRGYINLYVVSRVEQKVPADAHMPHISPSPPLQKQTAWGSISNSRGQRTPVWGSGQGMGCRRAANFTTCHPGWAIKFSPEVKHKRVI